MSKIVGAPKASVAAFLLLGLCVSANADEIVFENVRIFDGKNANLSEPSNVLIRDNKIAQISTASIEAEGAHRIDGDGRTLMPGLIDAHWHAMLVAVTPVASLGDVGYNNLVAGDEANDTLMRGFTTVRDVEDPYLGSSAQ